MLDITAALTDADPRELAGNLASYGELKKDCADAVIASLEPIQRHCAELIDDPTGLTTMLARGAEQARAQAEPVLERAKTAIGLL